MNDETAMSVEPGRRMSMKDETLAVATVLAVVIVVNLLTSTMYPVAWLDEVMFTDPAANLAAGVGFHTTAWPLHERDSFFFGYAPLYSALLAGWIDLIGFGMTQVRAFNYLLVCALSLALWAWSRKTGLISHPTARIALVLLVCLGYGIAFGYRSGRPDVLMALVATMCLLAMTMSAGPLKDPLVIASWTVMPLAGIQLIPYGLMMLGLGQFFYRPRALRSCAFGILGLLLGAGLLFVLYWHNQVLDKFLATMGNNTGSGLISTLLGLGTFRHENTIPKDFSLFLLIVAASIVWWSSRRVADASPQRRLLTFALAATAVVPVGMVLTGKFPTYYSWMIYLPLVIGTMAAYSLARPGPAKFAVNACLVLACALGLPFQLAYAWHDSADRDHQRVLEIIGPIVSRSDYVIVDYGAYYTVRPRAAKVFAPHSIRSLTVNERARISLIVVDPTHAVEIQDRVGGHWRAVGATILPSQHMLIEDLIGSAVNFGAFERKYRLQAYARVGQ